MSGIGFFGRWMVALVLVMGAFNPSGYSYYHWVVTTPPQDDLPLKALAGVVLAILLIIYLRATMRSIGAVGVILISLLFAAVIWVLIDYGFLALDSGMLIAWIVLIILSVILGIGMSWSHIRRRLSGQLDVDDVDQD